MSSIYFQTKRNNMKILKIILTALALLIVGFLLMGVFKSSVTYGNEIKINKPAKEVWAVMMDESKSSLWLEGIKSQELISGTAGEVGAVSKMVMEDIEMMETIAAITKNEHINLKFDADMMTQDMNMWFTEKDGKTTIKSETVAVGKNILWKSIFAMMNSGMVEEDLKVLTNLKKVVEENTTDYFPAPMVETMEDAAIDANQQ